MLKSKVTIVDGVPTKTFVDVSPAEEYDKFRKYHEVTVDDYNLQTCIDNNLLNPCSVTIDGRTSPQEAINIATKGKGITTESTSVPETNSETPTNS